jgi:hypothetical protein
MGNTLPVKLPATDDVFNRIQQTLQKTKKESKTAKQQNSKTGETVYSEWRVNETR